jgi:hypothetical protein
MAWHRRTIQTGPQSGLIGGGMKDRLCRFLQRAGSFVHRLVVRSGAMEEAAWMPPPDVHSKPAEPPNEAHQRRRV